MDRNKKEKYLVELKKIYTIIVEASSSEEAEEIARKKDISEYKLEAELFDAEPEEDELRFLWDIFPDGYISNEAHLTIDENGITVISYDF